MKYCNDIDKPKETLHKIGECNCCHTQNVHLESYDYQYSENGINKTYTDWLCPLCGARMKEARGLLDDKYWDYRAWGRGTYQGMAFVGV